jgi:hypothetical protein
MRYLLFFVILFSCQSVEPIKEQPKPAIVETVAPAPAVKETFEPDPNLFDCTRGKTAKRVELAAAKEGGCVVLQDKVIIYSAKHNNKYCADMFVSHKKHLIKKGFVCK